MTNNPYEDVVESMKAIGKIARQLGVSEGIEPFLTLAFLALPVIPTLKLTDKGLFDVTKFDFVDIND